MKISASAPSRSISFEFFPPQSTEATLRLWRSVERLAPLGPSFVSVTYGAGGTTRDRTLAAIQTIQDRARLSVMGHLTCVGASRADTLEVARRYRKLGVTGIVALRGDPPKGAGGFEAHPEGFTSGLDLVEGLAKDGWRSITVAAYPEKHPEARDMDADIDTLRAKQDAGATAVIAQFCFETEDFLRFRDRAVAKGVTLPIHPGILPVENFDKMAGFARRCGAGVPDWLEKAFRAAQTEEDATLLATAIATEQGDLLLSEGVPHLHFYTLNNPDLVHGIVRTLGFEPAAFSLRAGGQVA
ncbi:MAG: methylenetetrahydrofolate reductase [Pseudomonadota bacterium]